MGVEYITIRRVESQQRHDELSGEPTRPGSRGSRATGRPSCRFRSARPDPPVVGLGGKPRWREGFCNENARNRIDFKFDAARLGQRRRPRRFRPHSPG